MNKALVTGSFDPPTVGHLALLTKAASIFDQVVICVFHNSEKQGMFTAEQRVEMLRKAVLEAGLENVQVDHDEGFVADYAAKHGITSVVRGVRNSADVEYELEMARYNKSRNPALDTYLWMAPMSQKDISSTKVRDFLHHGVLPSDILPKTVAQLVREYLGVGFSST